MKAIFASKLYQSSDRKEAIKSALQNPLNKGLVQQLEEYLDEPVEQPEDKEESEDKKSVKKVSKKSSDDESKDSGEDRPVRKSGINISHSPRPSADNAPTEETEPSVSPDKTSATPATEDDSSVEEAFNIEESSCNGKKKKKVRSSVKSSIFYVPSFSVDTLIGTLKSNESTSMVDRVRIKDDKELWIFYNDSVNLNDIMNDVIELVNAAGYSHLEFNRLARSDNAIVFEFTLESIPMESKEESDSDDVEIEGVEIGEKITE